MKPREPRRKVMISARLRDGVGWSDARILDVSSRGLLLRASKTPERGSYVEVCKGPYRIVARVIWVQQDRFGVRTQDTLPIDAITNGVEPSSPEAQNLSPERSLKQREPTSAEQLERSRTWASAMQFLWVAGFGAAAATLVFDTVKSALARPLSVISAELTPKR